MRAVILASDRKRSTNSGSEENSGLSTFTAILRSSTVSLASQT